MVDLTINGGSQTLNGTYSYDNVNITNGGILYVTPYNGTGTTGTLILNVTNNVYIDSTSSINGSGRGYLGGARGVKPAGGSGGSGPGGGSIGQSGFQCFAGGWTGAGGGGGGGYGTVGGSGGGSWGNHDCIHTYGGSGGTTYGTTNGIDIDMGSGAGGGGSAEHDNAGSGGAGGAAITINAQNITVSGSILANGGNGGTGSTANGGYYSPGGAGGGASGGGIKLDAPIININNAAITANGGSGATTGGGGRIKLYYGTLNETGTTISAGTIYRETTAGSAYFTSTQSDARIWIDSVDQGVNTPNTITGLSPGSHTYKLVSGIYTATGSFSVTTGITTNVPTTIVVTALNISSNTYACIDTCQVTITTTWRNNGNTDITFRPAITVDTVPV